jgi:hypothetical protein
MAVTINLSSTNVDASANNFVYAIGTLSFSGNYSTGGDTLDFSTVASLIPSDQPPINVIADSNGGTGTFGFSGGYFQVIAGTALNNWKIKLIQAGGAEQGPGAYGSNVTTDSIFLNITYRKLL